MPLTTPGNQLKPIKVFWYQHPNVGDTLTPIILDWLKVPYVRAEARESGKLLSVGSILSTIKEGDVVWGSGFIDDVPFTRPPNVAILAARGPLTARKLGEDVTVFGDPALLMPLIYDPPRPSLQIVGCIPHYVEHDERIWQNMAGRSRHRLIDVRLPLKEFIDQLCACHRVITSSLHAYILAEAYGVPVAWCPVTDKVIGGGFKFRDYFLGTDRDDTGTGPLTNLLHRQIRLLSVLDQHLYGEGSCSKKVELPDRSF